jgi:hypothetical protein
MEFHETRTVPPTSVVMRGHSRSQVFQRVVCNMDVHEYLRVKEL